MDSKTERECPFCHGRHWYTEQDLNWLAFMREPMTVGLKLYEDIKRRLCQEKQD